MLGRSSFSCITKIFIGSLSSTFGRMIACAFALHAFVIWAALGNPVGLGYGYPPTTMKPQLTCSSPFLLDKDVCKAVKTVDPAYTCSKNGSYYDDHKCILIEEVPKVAKCPNGAETDGKKCVLLDKAPPLMYCPRGFSASADGATCVFEDIRKPEAVCSPNYSNQSGQCLSSVVLPATPACPDGYVIQTNGKTKSVDCVAAEIIGQSIICPPDYEPLGDMCVYNEFSYPVPYCPQGYTDDGDFCTKVYMMEPDAACSVGELNANKKDCVVVDAQPPSPACKKDYIFNGNTCVKIFESDIDFLCPIGFKMIDNECVGQESADAEFSCPYGTVPQEKFCVVTEEAPMTYKCNKGEHTASAQTCVHTDTVEPTAECPPNHVKFSDGCVMTHIVETAQACETGALEGKMCVTHKSIPSEAYCPDNMELSRGICVGKTVKNIMTVCPSGYKLQGKGLCVLHLEDDVQYVCPDNNTIQKGKTCVSQLIVAPLLSCPKNFMMDPTGNCFTSEFAEPNILCPEGHKMVQGHCVSETQSSSLQSNFRYV